MPRYVDHHQRRSEVTEVAAQLVAAEGRRALTVRRVAEAAGQSTTVVSITKVLDRDPADVLGLAEALLPLDRERQADWRIWLAFWGEALGSAALAAEQRTRASTSADRFLHCLQLLATEGRIDSATDICEPIFNPRKWTAAKQRRAVEVELQTLGFDAVKTR